MVFLRLEVWKCFSSSNVLLQEFSLLLIFPTGYNNSLITHLTLSLSSFMEVSLVSQLAFSGMAEPQPALWIPI
jgi:hypothetical protein